MLNTSYLYKPILVITVYMFAIHFISVNKFPPLILLMVAWYFVMRSLNDDGRWIKISFIIILLDLLSFMFFITSGSIPGLEYVVYLPLGVLLVLMLFALIAANEENMYFNRTVQSMNPHDRKLAIKALKSQDPNDFAEVAEYTSWDMVS